MNVLTRAFRVVLERLQAAAQPGGVLDGATVVSILSPDDVDAAKLPFIGLVPERSANLEGQEYVGSQAMAYVDIGVRIFEDAKYGYYFQEDESDPDSPYTRGLLVLLERFQDAIDQLGIGQGTDLTGSNFWMTSPKVEVRGFFPKSTAGYIGYGINVRLLTNLYDRGQMSTA